MWWSSPNRTGFSLLGSGAELGLKIWAKGVPRKISDAASEGICGRPRNSSGRPQTEVCATRSRLRQCALAWACLAVALPVRATTYYVDNCVTPGSDLNTGTSPATAWRTVAHVNAQTFNPGDSILFQRTCAWYGTALTAPSAGASGSPITFGAYGTGANPILKGSTVLITSGFALAGPTTVAIFHRPDTGTNISDGATRNIRDAIGHQDIALSASAISIYRAFSPAAIAGVQSHESLLIGPHFPLAKKTFVR